MRSCLRRARAGPRRLLRGIMGRHPPYGCQNLGHVLRRCRTAGGTAFTHPAARRPGRRRSLRRGAAVLSCRRGENTANSGPGHSRGFEPASASPSVPVPNPCPKRPQRAATAFRPTAPASGTCRARTGGVRRPAGVAQPLFHRGSVSRFRQNATAMCVRQSSWYAVVVGLSVFALVAEQLGCGAWLVLSAVSVV
jgi:hypothetical protein